ncbi:hypothetical protein BV97_03969 [Novosphingobium resinovorum]|uniref:Uncharacterized protein n=1 Tax=Novosphingobium resinovorum TaxID=158500 RepID=A0A031JT31_9SPHN|nr:hypothetical protein [Novosphingobium resinovorum]EZP79532.1 hypothetical protein BV97_03969 [Novosphingobium resinovorum]
MSSYIILQKRDAVHFITDGAGYDDDGVIRSIDGKSFILRNAGSAIISRGALYGGSQAAAFLSACVSFDHLVDTLPSVMRLLLKVRDSTTAGESHPLDRHFLIAAGGWSDRLQAMVAVIATTFEACDPSDPEGLSCWPGYEQFMPFLAPTGFLNPPVNLREAIGRDVQDAEALEGIDAVGEGRLLIEAQRRIPMAYRGKPRYLVGGFGELVTVTRDSIERVRLCDWPDEIGAYIQPDGAPSLEDLTASLQSAAPLFVYQDEVSCAA